MRKIIYVIILSLLFLAPVKRLDIANLQPVQTVGIYTEPGSVVLETDTHNIGRGETVADAVLDLEKNTPGVIYLDTAEYLLVSKDAQSHVDALREYLKPSVKVCLWEVNDGIDMAARFLFEEDNLPKLKNWSKS